MKETTSRFKYRMVTPTIKMDMDGFVRGPEHSAVIMCALDGQLSDSADLLKAAPALLAACHKAWEEIGEAKGYTGDPDAHQHMRLAIETLRDAIALTEPKEC